MNIIHRINAIVGFAVLVVCGLVVLIFGWSASGWEALAVPTGSMRPTMPPGSLALVRSVPTSSLKVGDVITYVNPLHPSTTLSHRITKKIKIDGKVPGFITKGDANKVEDIPVVAGAVKGKVVWHISQLGYWLSVAKRPIVILPVLYLVGILTVIEEMKRLSDYYKTQHPYRLEGYEPEESALPKRSFAKLYAGISVSLGTLVTISCFGPSAMAAMRSNAVALTGNKITIGHIVQKCSVSTSNSSSVTISNSTTQNSSSGNAHSSNGSASSGNASNSNSSSFGVTVTQC